MSSLTQRSIPYLVVSLVAAAALAGGFILYRHYLVSAPLATSTHPAAEHNSDHVRGVDSAPVTVEEFGDFQCPPCGHLSEPLNDIERDYHNRVRLIFRQFPLANHANALPAALASEAAAMQGRFWEMHDLLYRAQESWSKAVDPVPFFMDYAQRLKLDLSRFENDVRSEATRERVAKDRLRGTELGVTLTPTVFVNGRSVAGPELNPPGLRAAIETALTQTPAKR